MGSRPAERPKKIPAGSPAPSNDKARIDELTRAIREKAGRDPEKFVRLLTEWLDRPAPDSRKSPTSPYRRRKLG